MSYAVFLQPIDEYTSPRNIALVGEVVNTEDFLLEGGPSKSSCDGLTSATPPRYADDGMVALYFESEEVAMEISRMVRGDFIQEVSVGNLKPREIPHWATNPTASSNSLVMLRATTASVRDNFSTDRVSDSQLFSAGEDFLQEAGRLPSSRELITWIENNRNWES